MANSAINTLHTIGALQLVSGAAGASTVSVIGLQDASVDPAVEQWILNAAGQIDQSYAAVSQQQPQISATCVDIAAALGANAIDHLDGFQINNALTNPQPADLYLAQLDTPTPTSSSTGATRKSGTNHRKIRINLGLAVLDELSVAQGAFATARIALHAIWDATNDPFVYTASIALPTAAQLAQLFTLGKCDINGVNVDGVQGWTYRPGIRVEKRFGGGQIWPTALFISERHPSLEIRTKEVSTLATYGISGAKGTTAFTAYLQKVDQFGTRIAAGTAVHVKLSGILNTYRVHNQQLSIRNNEDGETSILITPASNDGAAKPVSVATASAIT